MPTFYFHIRDESGTVKKDEEGADMADAKAARERAIQTGRQFLDREVSADGLQLDDVAKFAIEVMDESGQVVSTIPFQNFMGEELKDSTADANRIDR